MTMRNPRDQVFPDQGLIRAMSRRRFLQRTGALAGATAFTGLLTACADGADDAQDVATPDEEDGDDQDTAAAEDDEELDEEPDDLEAEDDDDGDDVQTDVTVTFAGARELERSDPLYIQNTEEIGMFQLVTEPLIRLDADMDLEPALAVSWESVDPTTWRLELREGVSFHNGEPFDADAAKFTIDQYRELGAEFVWFYIWGDELPEAEVVDEFTIDLVTTRPIPATPRNLALMYVMPPEAGSEDDFSDNLVGTGPYEIVEWVRDVRLELVSNPDYWDGEPEIGSLVYRAIPDPSARISAVQTGEVDIAAAILPDLVPVLEASGEVDIVQQMGVRIAHFPFNFRERGSPLEDVEVRRAMSLAIDGQSIVDEILLGAAEPIGGPVPSILFASADLGGYEYDPERARSMLEELDYPFDYPIEFMFSEGNFIKDREVVEVVHSTLLDLGMTVELIELESGEYITRRGTENWDITANGFSAMNGDPGFFLTWATNPVNFGYPREETREVIEDSFDVVSDDERAERLHEAQSMYWDDVPYLWAYNQMDIYAIRQNLEGIQPLSTGWIPFQHGRVTS